MSSIFKVNQVGLVWEKSEDYIYNERLRYEAIYDLIEDYVVKAKNIILGGSMSINLLLKRPRTYKDFDYMLYSENALKHANNLVNEIAKLIASKNMKVQIGGEEKDPVVFLKTQIPHAVYHIFVDTRLMVIMYELKSDPVKAFDLIEPIDVDSFDKKRKLPVLSPEIHLIETYHNLYSPELAGQWEHELVNEELLYELLEPRVKILGAEEQVSTKDKKDIENALLSEFVANSEGIILIGEHALKLVNQRVGKDDMQMSSQVIRVISENDTNADFEKVKNIVQKTLGRAIPVTMHTRNVNVMQDFRLMRTTIKVGSDSAQKEIMYIYNSGHFDLVPYNVVSNGKGKPLDIKIGNPFVLMRFLLIDLWVMRWVYRMGKVNEYFAKTRINNILNLILKLRKSMSGENHKIKDEFYSKENNVLNVFQRKDRYIGQFVDASTSQKIKSKEMRRYPTYYPQGHFNKNKSYREL